MNIEISWAAYWNCPFCKEFTDEDLDHERLSDQGDHWHVECVCDKTYTLSKEGYVDECN